MIELLRSTKSKITKDENGKNVLDLKTALVHCNFVNKDCQHDSRVLHIFVRNRSFGQLQDISPIIFKKIFNSEWSKF